MKEGMSTSASYGSSAVSCVHANARQKRLMQAFLVGLCSLLIAFAASFSLPQLAWAEGESETEIYAYDYDSNNDGVKDSWFFSADVSDAENLVYGYLADNNQTLVIAGKGATVENIDDVKPSEDTSKPSLDKSGLMETLKTIRVEEGVTYLGANLVRNTKGITVELPASLQSMNIDATVGAEGSYSTLGNNYYDSNSKTPEGISKITVAEGSQAFKVVDGVLFTVDGKTILRYTNEAAADYTIPGDVEVIAAKAFARTEKLTSITMNEGLLTIGQDSFDKVPNITEITIPSTVRNLGSAAFTACKSLAKATYLNTGFDVWKYQFNSENTALTEIDILGNLKELPINLFSGSSSVEKVILPSSLEVIGQRAFHLWTNLSTIEVANGDNLSNLRELTCNEEGYASTFYGDIKLTSIPISKNAPLEKIGKYAFYGTGLTELVVPENVKTIDTAAFSNCESLENVTFNTALTTINEEAFRKTNINALVISGAIESIGNNAFSNCTNLGEISISAT